jgi:hypothetical protein
MSKVKNLKEREILISIKKLGSLFKEFQSCNCPKLKEKITREIKTLSEKIHPRND